MSSQNVEDYRKKRATFRSSFSTRRTRPRRFQPSFNRIQTDRLSNSVERARAETTSPIWKFKAPPRVYYREKRTRRKVFKFSKTYKENFVFLRGGETRGKAETSGKDSTITTSRCFFGGRDLFWDRDENDDEMSQGDLSDVSGQRYCARTRAKMAGRNE